MLARDFIFIFMRVYIKCWLAKKAKNFDYIEEMACRRAQRERALPLGDCHTFLSLLLSTFDHKKYKYLSTFTYQKQWYFSIGHSTTALLPLERSPSASFWQRRDPPRRRTSGGCPSGKNNRILPLPLHVPRNWMLQTRRARKIRCQLM